MKSMNTADLAYELVSYSEHIPSPAKDYLVEAARRLEELSNPAKPGRN